MRFFFESIKRMLSNLNNFRNIGVYNLPQRPQLFYMLLNDWYDFLKLIDKKKKSRRIEIFDLKKCEIIC